MDMYNAKIIGDSTYDKDPATIVSSLTSMELANIGKLGIDIEASNVHIIEETGSANAEWNTIILVKADSAAVITLPPHEDKKDAINIYKIGAGQVTIQTQGGDTINDNVLESVVLTSAFNGYNIVAGTSEFKAFLLKSDVQDNLGFGTAGQVLATNQTADAVEWVDDAGEISKYYSVENFTTTGHKVRINIGTGLTFFSYKVKVDAGDNANVNVQSEFILSGGAEGTSVSVTSYNSSSIYAKISDSQYDSGTGYIDFYVTIFDAVNVLNVTVEPVGVYPLISVTGVDEVFSGQVLTNPNQNNLGLGTAGQILATNQDEDDTEWVDVVIDQNDKVAVNDTDTAGYLEDKISGGLAITLNEEDVVLSGCPIGDTYTDVALPNDTNVSIPNDATLLAEGNSFKIDIDFDATGMNWTGGGDIMLIRALGGVGNSDKPFAVWYTANGNNPNPYWGQLRLSDGTGTQVDITPLRDEYSGSTTDLHINYVIDATITSGNVVGNLTVTITDSSDSSVIDVLTATLNSPVIDPSIYLNDSHMDTLNGASRISGQGQSIACTGDGVSKVISINADINDASTAVDELWSSDKIQSELDSKKSSIAVNYKENGVIAYDMVLPLHGFDSGSVGFYVPEDGNSYTINAVEFRAGSLEASAATTLSFRVASTSINAATAYTLGDGTTLNTFTMLTASGPESVVYNSAVWLENPAQTALVNGTMIFVDVTPNLYTVQDIELILTIGVL